MLNIEDKQGYKYTEEFGYIPQNWEVKPLDECADFYNGLPHENDIKEYGQFKLVNAKFVSTKGEIFKNVEFPKFLLEKGDVTIVISDIPNGKTLARTFFIDKDNAYSLNYRVACIRTTSVFNKYLNIHLNRHPYFLSFNDGVNQTNLKKEDILKCPLLLPTYKEQEKIAEVLGDVDGLIDKTQQLINKKKDLKTATMQKLQTPKEDWKKSILGEYVRVQGGYSFNSEKFINNGIPIIRISNIYNDDVIIDNETVFYEPINISREFIISKGDVLIAMSGATTGKVGMYRYKNQAYQNQRVGKFVAINKDTVMGYIKQFLKSHQFINELNKSIAQGAQPNISSKQIEEIELVIPSRAEQEQIATILSDMDSEIEALEKELNKYKDLKTGMMQQLLTGKVRLI